MPEIEDDDDNEKVCSAHGFKTIIHLEQQNLL